MRADDSVCMAMTKACVDKQQGEPSCLSSRDLSGYDYISVSKDWFIPRSVKPTEVGRLENVCS